MASFTKSLKVGNPFDGDVDIGPIQNVMQFDSVRSFVDDCETQGYNVAAEIEWPNPGKGYFI